MAADIQSDPDKLQVLAQASLTIATIKAPLPSYHFQVCFFPVHIQNPAVLPAVEIHTLQVPLQGTHL
jgi:hypothetical protein